MQFNPFGKPFEEITTVEDLKSLTREKVTEGWHVEYKSGMPSNESIAKSIASFANSRSGWFIVGVETDDKLSAKNICGVEISSVQVETERLYNIAKSRILPCP